MRPVQIDADCVYNSSAMILKLDTDDPDRELAFELDYLLSLSTRERFEMMFRKSEAVWETLLRHGYRKPSEITKR